MYLLRPGVIKHTHTPTDILELKRNEIMTKPVSRCVFTDRTMVNAAQGVSGRVPLTLDHTFSCFVFSSQMLHLVCLQ